MRGWTWAAARARGTSHLRAGLRCQDMRRVRSDKSDLVAIVSDGAGSAVRGGAGAALVCRMLAGLIAGWLPTTGGLPSDEVARGWIDVLRAALEESARRHGLAPRDLAATLVAVIARGEDALLLLVGDGAAAVRAAEHWIVPSWPEHGEYASTTRFVTDDMLSLRLVRVACVDAVALMSDGLERLALDFGGRCAHAPFFNGLFRPVEASAAIGEDRALSVSLARWLDGEAVNARTDDDKAVVLAVRR